MIYSMHINTEHTTYATQPKRTPLLVVKGLVYKVEIDFPPGPSGLLKVQIYDGNHQVWPSTPGEYFASDHSTISFDETMLKMLEPFRYDVYTVNEDETYDHGIVVRIGMVSEVVYMARFLPTYANQDLMVLLEESKAAEIERQKAIISTPFSWLERE